MRVSFVAVALAMALIGGCYDVPQPECGFACGPGLECPGGYTCNTRDRRCHLDGTAPRHRCPGPDGGIDTTAPSLASAVPGPGELGAPETTVTVVFSENVVDVDATTFVLREEGEIPIAGTVTYDELTATAVFRPNAPLTPGSNVTVSLASQIRDLWSNPFPGVIWVFHVAGDSTPPQVTSTNPADGATGVNVTTGIGPIFSEDVLNVSSATFRLFEGTTPVPSTVVYTSFPPSASLTPDAGLAPNTTYTATLDGSIVDHAGNALLPYAWTFTTAP